MNFDPYIKAMFGPHAVRAAFNYIVQPAEGQRAAIVGNTTFAKDMSFGGLATGLTHTLVLCDVVIRPHLVIASSHLAGCGAAGLLRTGLSDPDPWLQNGKLLFQR